ncbi:hypothetical protein J6590_099748 [Homalodisca vitripennis]|nr:hypothetical protein J6590_099748 [Homalodisca vitripennis]
MLRDTDYGASKWDQGGYNLDICWRAENPSHRSSYIVREDHHDPVMAQERPIIEFYTIFWKYIFHSTNILQLEIMSTVLYKL